jgi:hypothetical protein
MLAALLALLQACSASTLPRLAPSPGPEESTAPSADAPYRPVMAGTVHHALESTP